MDAQSAYDRKIAEAKSVVEDHNARLPETKEGEPSNALSWDTILAKLQSFGGTTDSALRNVTWEDLQDCGIPRILARKIANEIFRKNGDRKPRMTSHRVETMSFEELFEHYDPTGEQNPAVTKRLKEESEGKPCVVINSGHVLAPLCAQLLREIKEGLTPREIYNWKGGMFRVLKIGETDQSFYSENFLYPGEPLRGSTCDKTQRDVSEVPLRARQIVYLAVKQTREITINSLQDAHQVLDILAGAADPNQTIQERCPRATILLQDLENTNSAPSLKLSRKRLPKVGSNDPFSVGHRRT
jgi:hypothetical protein